MVEQIEYEEVVLRLSLEAARVGMGGMAGGVGVTGCAGRGAEDRPLVVAP